MNLLPLFPNLVMIKWLFLRLRKNSTSQEEDKTFLGTHCKLSLHVLKKKKKVHLVLHPHGIALLS